LLDVVVMASTLGRSGSLMLIMSFFQLLGHVRVDEAGVGAFLPWAYEFLADLSVGDPLHDPGAHCQRHQGRQVRYGRRPR